MNMFPILALTNHKEFVQQVRDDVKVLIGSTVQC